jgi:group I intron endonuclease
MKTAYIYKITNTITTDIYIGSTIQKLKSRFKAHKSNANLNKNGKLYDYMRENGIDKFNIELVEQFKYELKSEIGIKEKKYYNELKPSLNLKTPNVCLDNKYGRIYKLFNKLDTTKFYIGSTIKKLNDRLSAHCSASIKGKTPLYEYMRNIGKEKFTIELIEDNIEVDNLIIRENYWIQELKPNLNKNIFLTRTEKERDKHKYEKNKEKIKKRVNERRLLKRDEINAQKREHYAKNKEKILAKQNTQEYKDRANKLRRERRARKKEENLGKSSNLF